MKRAIRIVVATLACAAAARSAADDASAVLAPPSATRPALGAPAGPGRAPAPAGRGLALLATATGWRTRSWTVGEAFVSPGDPISSVEEDVREHALGLRLEGRIWAVEAGVSSVEARARAALPDGSEPSRDRTRWAHLAVAAAIGRTRLLVARGGRVELGAVWAEPFLRVGGASSDEARSGDVSSATWGAALGVRLPALHLRWSRFVAAATFGELAVDVQTRSDGLVDDAGFVPALTLRAGLQL